MDARSFVPDYRDYKLKSRSNVGTAFAKKGARQRGTP
jgi:hypothetical protein